MADTIRGTVELDTRQAVRQLDALGKNAVLKLQADGKAVTAELDRIDRQIENLRKRRDIAVRVDANGDEVAALERQLAALGDERVSIVVDVEGAAAAAAEIDRAAQDQTATIDVEAEGGFDAAGLFGGLDGLIGKIPGLEQIGSLLGGAGGSAASLGESLGGAAAATGPLIAALAVAAAGIAALKAGFEFVKSSVNETLELGKAVRSISSVSGVAAEDASRLVIAFGRVGAEAGDINDVLLNIQQKANDGSLAQLGVNLDPGGSAIDNLLQIADAYAAAGTESQKAAIAAAALGEEGARQFIPFLKDGAAGFRAVLDSVPKGGLLSQTDLDNQQRLVAANAKLSESFDSIKTQVGKAVIPVIVQLAEGFAKLAPILEPIGRVLGDVISAGLQGTAQAAEILTDGLGGLINAVADLADLANGIPGVGRLIPDGFAEKARAAADGMTGFGDTIAGRVAPDADSAALSVDGLGASFTGAAETAEAAAARISGVISGAIGASAVQAQQALVDAQAAAAELSQNQALGQAALQIQAGVELAPDAVLRLQQALVAQGYSIPVDGQLGEGTKAALDAAILAGGPIQVPTQLDAAQVAVQLAEAAAQSTQAAVDAGTIPAGQQLDALAAKLQEIRGQQVFFGGSPELIAELDAIIGRLGETKTAAGEVGAAWQQTSSFFGKGASAVVELKADSKEVDEAIVQVTKPVETPVTVTDQGTADVVKAKVDNIPDKTVDVDVRESGLDELIDRLNNLSDRTIRVTIDWNEINRPPGFYRGGRPNVGEPVFVSERGRESYLTDSGVRYSLPEGPTLMRFSERGRVLTAGETRVAESRTVNTGSSFGDTTINVTAPDPLLAGKVVFAAWRKAHS